MAKAVGSGKVNRFVWCFSIGKVIAECWPNYEDWQYERDVVRYYLQDTK